MKWGGQQKAWERKLKKKRHKQLVWYLVFLLFLPQSLGFAFFNLSEPRTKHSVKEEICIRHLALKNQWIMLHYALTNVQAIVTKFERLLCCENTVDSALSKISPINQFAWNWFHSISAVAHQLLSRHNYVHTLFCNCHGNYNQSILYLSTHAPHTFFGKDNQ